MSLTSPWRRPFTTPSDSTFFEREIRADLQQVADILDESKAHVLPLETIETPIPTPRWVVGVVCFVIGMLIAGVFA